MENEKRSRERIPMTQAIELSTSDGHVIQAQGINVSEGGLLCQTDSEIPLGTFIIFQLPVSNEKSAKTIQCEGTVLRCGKAGSENEGKYHVVIYFSE